MQYRLVARRTTAVLLPAALLLCSASPALAKGKPVRPTATPLSAKPANPTNAGSASFAWSEQTGLNYKCSLDGAALSVCNTGKSYTGLVAGSHSFVLRTISDANKRFAATSYSWVVDTTPPAVSVQPVAGPTSSTSASVNFSAGDSTTVVCSLDNVVVPSCAAPMSLTGLSEGTRTFKVVGTDAAGNTASAATSWVIDRKAPSIPVVTLASTLTNSTGMNLTFTAEETPTCTLDGAAYTPCANPVTLTGLPQGRHSFAVTSTDAAGNTSTGSASWVEDLTPPTKPFLVTSPASPTNETTAAIAYSVDADTAAVDCTLDGAALSPCPTQLTLANLSTGSHTVVITPRDAAGNVGEPLPVTWTIDPTVSTPAEVISGPPAQGQGTSVVFEFDTSDDSEASFQCSVDGAAPVACVSGDPITVYGGDGTHTVTVTALDAAGNPSSTTTYNFVVDTTAPAAPSVASETVDPTTGAYDLVLDLPADVTSLTCVLDGVSTPCSSTIHLEGLAAGDHTLTVIAADAAGNTTTMADRTFTVPAIAPAPTSTTTDPAPTSTTTDPAPTSTTTDPAPTSTTTDPAPAPASPAQTSADVTAPHATAVTAPRLVGELATVTFDEDVLGASASSVTLATPGTAPIATTARCTDAAGTTVSCSGPVRAIALTPTRALVPGQRYAVGVSSAVTDAAGNAASLTPLLVRAVLLQQESSPAVSGAWRQIGSSAALGSRYGIATLAGASATYAFTGTAITWYTATGPAMGKARVYVDGVLKATVNNWASANRWKVARSVTGLAAGAHRLTISVLGVKGSTAGTGTGVVVDAVRVGATTVTNPALVTTWGVVGASPASGQRFAVADKAGETLTMRFRGTRLTWQTVTAANMGKARVYIDGVLKGTYDNFSSSTRYGVKRAFGLADGVHVVKIVVVGAHRSGASGNRVAVDSLLVG